MPLTHEGGGGGAETTVALRAVKSYETTMIAFKVKVNTNIKMYESMFTM